MVFLDEASSLQWERSGKDTVSKYKQAIRDRMKRQGCSSSAEDFRCAAFLNVHVENKDGVSTFYFTRCSRWVTQKLSESGEGKCCKQHEKIMESGKHTKIHKRKCTTFLTEKTFDNDIRGIGGLKKEDKVKILTIGEWKFGKEVMTEMKRIKSLPKLNAAITNWDDFSR